MAMGATGDTCTAHRFDSSSWLVLAGALGYIVACVVYVLLAFQQPTDGWVYNNDLNAPTVAQSNQNGEPSPLRAGDVVLATDGVPVAQRQVLLRPQPPPPGWRVGGAAHYTVQRDGQQLDLIVLLVARPAVALPRYMWSGANGTSWPLLSNVLWFAIGFVVFLIRPRDTAARLLLLIITYWATYGAILSADTSVTMYFYPAALFWYGIVSNLLWPLMFAMIAHFVLAFPVLKWPLRRRPRLTLALLYGVPAGGLALRLILADDAIFLATLFLTMGTIVVALIAVTVHNLRTVRDPVARAQIGWLALGLSVPILSAIILQVTNYLLPELNIESVGWLWDNVFALFLPICLGIAITRYRLFDIDVVINRALVYGTLTACVIGVYVGLVSYLSSLFPAQNGFVSPLIATGVVAVLFQPLRERLQRGVNRLIYGERDEPYAVMARLGQRLEGTLAVDDLLPTIAETVARALKVPSVALCVKHRGELTLAAEYATERRTTDAASPQSPSASVALPLVAQGETVGELRLALRPGESTFSPADQRLLHDLTRQAGIAVQAARLTSDLRQLTVDLQQSRERLVTTREEERRRLRRDLHDGLGPALASLTFKVDAARNLLHRDVSKADRLLASVTDQMQETIADIRRLVYDLRPPALDQLGLAAALRQYVAHLDTRTHIAVEAPADFTALPAAVEVAAYRIALEAITNVLRHAGAQQCVVALTTDENTLIVEVRDNGQGLPAQRHDGVGLRAMHERAAELGGICTIEALPGGGTLVQARLPLIAYEPLERKQVA